MNVYRYRPGMSTEEIYATICDKLRFSNNLSSYFDNFQNEHVVSFEYKSKKYRFTFLDLRELNCVIDRIVSKEKSKLKIKKIQKIISHKRSRRMNK